MTTNTKYKTTIKCAGCVEKVRPFLNETVGEGKWKIDYSDPSKILEVDYNGDPDKVIHALEKAGYKGQKL